MTELKPCPFCGGKAKIIQTHFESSWNDYCICCEDCRARTITDASKKYVIEQWNRRNKK